MNILRVLFPVMQGRLATILVHITEFSIYLLFVPSVVVQGSRKGRE